MKTEALPSSHVSTRRDFLATSAKAATGAALAGALARPGYAAENNTIKIGRASCRERV